MLTFFLGFDISTALPIAVALIAFATAYGFDFTTSRVITLLGLVATIYAALAPYLDLMQPGKFRTSIIIAGVLLSALNRSLVTQHSAGIRTKNE